MKLIHKISKIGPLATFVGLLMLVACKDDLPKPLDTSSNVTVLNNIKIVNAGANGNIVLQGVVDEDAKTVWFPRIDTLTDFSKLKFEAEVSGGAKLDKEVYPVTFEAGQSEQVIVVKVMSSPRFREYLVRLRLQVPVYGADFEKGTTYDFSNNPLGQSSYDAFNGQATRGSGFDGEKVLVVRREAPHVLNVSDLKAGTINKIPLNITGVVGGTFITNMGAQVNGHTYVANLSGGQTSPLKVYHWTDPSAAPQIIANLNVATIAGAGVRHGDNFSAALDDQGNGFLFFGDNAATKVLRLSVANYTTVSNPTVFAMPLTGAGAWTTYNRIGNTSEYLFTGHGAQLALVNDGGTSTFTTTKMTTLANGTSFPITSSDARIVYFNGERYLIVVTAPIGANAFSNLRVYDITKGSNVRDALTNLNNLPTITPIFDYSLMGPIVNGSPAVQSGFHVKKDGQGKDEKLMLYAATVDGGFVFFEFPVKTSD
ncbi:MAG: DUF4623 domain-containing protein [Pedobacter sp.]|uniref:DUF4623 domain-containing protein n=1 Tax=Pedobacter sp. TaxID=1411316 RepID=UPI002806B283|nr:DUF4623 domain-containing protein [Pedobacter sp.]MDQ8006113.1 DUF4623 domain-containing protein [Pedobacter sp.]